METERIYAMNYKEAIREFIRTNLPRGQHLSNIKDTDNLIKSGVMDSLGIMSLASYLEENFSIQITTEDIVAKNFESVTAISSYIQKKIVGNGGFEPPASGL